MTVPKIILAIGAVRNLARRYVTMVKKNVPPATYQRR
jgi:hypothetical protein